MQRQALLFQKHLDFAHLLWRQFVKAGDWVIDATCGNGYDTLHLARLALAKDTGAIFGCDLQEVAIQNTRERLQVHLEPDLLKQVHLKRACHATYLKGFANNSVKLIVYNLGYLPGGDKAITTMTASTLESLQTALACIKPGGAVCLTCYPGHEAGKKETEEVLAFAKKLPPAQWSCSHHQWFARATSPSVLILQRLNQLLIRNEP